MIIADDREPSIFKSRAGRVHRLKVGDYWVCKSGLIVRIERKTYSDLHTSLQTGRLNWQLDGIDELILMQDGWQPRTVFSLLHSEKMLDLINGIQEHTVLKFATGIDDFFRRLGIVERKLADGTYRSIRKGVVILREMEDPRLQVLASFPGVDHVRARAILSSYDTLEAAFADVGEWSRTVEGVGKGTAKAALNVLRTSKNNLQEPQSSGGAR